MGNSINREKILFIFAVIILSTMAVILMVANSAQIVLGADCSCEEKKYTDTEIIFDRVECSNCDCNDAGKPLFIAHGTDADCERAETEGERGGCYLAKSHWSYACDYIENETLKRRCESSAPYKMYYGEAGSFGARGEIITNGVRTYFVGFDAEGKHKIKSGFAELAAPIIFREASRDIEIGENLNVGVGGNETLRMLSEKSGVYFNSNPEYSLAEVDDGIWGMEMTGADTGDRIMMSGNYNPDHDDLVIGANNQNVIVFPDNTDERTHSIDYFSGTKKVTPIEVRKGLEADAVATPIDLLIQNKRIFYSKAIRNSSILFYDPPINR